MFGETFNFRIIYKVLASFGSLFNELMLIKYNKATGQETGRQLVPIDYARKQEYLVRTINNRPIDKQVNIVYPRLSFKITSIEKDQNRQLSPTAINTAYDSTGENFRKQLNPVPYDINIELYIIGKQEEDVLQIVERILPYFHPQFALDISVVPQLSLRDAVPIILRQVTFDDSFDGAFDSLSSIVWTLQFTAKVNFYGRITEQGLIRKVSIDLLIPEGEITADSIEETPRSARITVEPDPVDAEPDENYEVETTVEEFDDNKKYSPDSGEDEDV